MSFLLLFSGCKGTVISPLGQYHMGCKKTTIQGVKNIPYIWYKAAKRMVCMMDKDVCPIYNKVYLWIDLNMAAAGVAILDNPYLGGDALAHCVGMTADAHLLALRTLQHGEGVDDGG